MMALPSIPTPSSAWIDPTGKFFPVRDCGHEEFAYHEFETSASALETRGWLHVSFGDIHRSRSWSVTNSQLDTLYDTLMVYRDAAYEYVERFSNAVDSVMAQMNEDTY